MVQIKILFVLLLSSCRMYAQEVVFPDSLVSTSQNNFYGNTYQTDSLLHTKYETRSTLYLKHFEPNFRDKYKGDEFIYNSVKPHESFWQKLLRKINRILESIFGKAEPGTTGTIAMTAIRIAAILTCGIVLYIIVRYLAAKEGGFFFSKRNHKTAISENDIEENIHKIDFSTHIAESERNGDYRSAVRWLFLAFLKKLSDRNIIIWHPEKTNTEYSTEIKDPVTAMEFTQLALVFDHIWYGTFKVTDREYQYFKKQFESVNQRAL